MFFYKNIKIQGLGSDILKATQNISRKYAYNTPILCIKIFKMKSYSIEFKSKKVLSWVFDNSGLFEKTFQ